MNTLKEIFKYSSVRTKKILTNSIIVSVIRYAAPILINSNNTLISKLQVVLMKCSRPILGFKSYKYSTQRIMKELNWLNAYQIVTKETIIFIHKIIYDNQPKAMTQFFTFSLTNSQNHRFCRKSIVTENISSSKGKKSLIFFGNHLYNTLPNNLKLKNPKQLSKYLQNHISYHFPFDRLPNFDPGWLYYNIK